MICSGKKINGDKFGEYELETAKQCISNEWCYMPASVHKLLIHGKDIVENFSIPIGQLSEEASEARNKEFRKYREFHTRKTSRTACNEDLLNYLLLTSDPLISSIRKRARNVKRKDIFPEALELLI